MSLDVTQPVRSVSIDELIARCDESDLHHLVGSHAVRLLRALDPKLGFPSKLQELCLQLHSHESLLRNSESRRRLLLSLRTEEAVSLASRLKLEFTTSKSAFPALLDASIRKNSSRERSLFEFFGVSTYEKEPEQQAPTIRRAEPQYGLFSHQHKAQMEVLRSFESGKRRVLLHMPTGAGKTRTAMHVVATELLHYKPSVAVWLAYSEELCEQAADEFEKAWSYLGDRSLDVYRYWGAERNLDIKDVHDGFMIAGLSKLYERTKRDSDFITRLADRASLVVIDEAHQAVAETYSFLLDFLVERNTHTDLLGLTATPGRTWDDPYEDEKLANFFNYNKVTLKTEGFDNPVEHLISEGYLANPKFRSLPFVNGTSLSNYQIKRLATALEIPETILKSLSESVQRNMLIVDSVEELASRHKRILLFAATVQHAKLLATVLRARGIWAASISYETEKQERQHIIHSYKSDDSEPMVLCNYGVLTAGFDAPRTSAEVIARPTKSLVLYSQMVGRAIRGTLADGNSEAEIVTIVDTQLPGFRDMTEAFVNWEDVWKNEQKIPTIHGEIYRKAAQ